MPTNRYFTPSSLALKEQIVLEEPEAHHLLRVSRKETGEQVELINGRGTLALSTLILAEKGRATLEVRRILEQAAPPFFTVILAQGIPRTGHLDWIIEKSTELGLAEIWLFPGMVSERQTLKEHQLQRLKNLSIAAMKQSGCLFLPQIILKPPLDQWKPPYQLPLYFGDLNPKSPPLLHLWQTSPPKKGALFFIGPESGLTIQEINLLKKWKAEGIKLHNNILRTETASIAAICLAAHWALFQDQTPQR